MKIYELGAKYNHLFLIIKKNRIKGLSHRLKAQNLMLAFDDLVVPSNRHTIIHWFELSFTSQWIRSNITTLAGLSSICQLAKVDINTHSQVDHSLLVIMRSSAVVFLSFFFVPSECQSKSDKACEENDF